MIGYLQGRTFVTCSHGEVRPGSREHEPDPGCGQEAIILIVSEEEVWHAGDVVETMTVAAGSCALHAFEDAHEAGSSMADDEFVIVRIGGAA